MTMDEMKEKWPEWYQKRVVEINLVDILNLIKLCIIGG